MSRAVTAPETAALKTRFRTARKSYDDRVRIRNWLWSAAVLMLGVAAETHSLSCGSALPHAFQGYETPDGHLGWNTPGRPHYQARLERSVGQSLLGLVTLALGVVAGVGIGALLWSRQRPREHEGSTDWRAMELRTR